MSSHWAEIATKCQFVCRTAVTQHMVAKADKSSRADRKNAEIAENSFLE